MNVGREDFADLHVHTNFSDGLLSPEEVVRNAAKLGLGAIAITDHDCVDAITPAIKEAKSIDLEIIPGVEISAAIGHTEIHILGYFIDWCDPDLSDLLEKMRLNRVDRMRKIVARLKEQGLELDIERVLESAPQGTVGRQHLARIMKEEGFVATIQEAFDRFIGNGKPCHIEHKRLDYKRAFETIKRSGGVPVLAHPGTADTAAYFPDFIKAGLRGIEVYHSDHRPIEEQRYLALAEEYDLLITGGSDCHGIERRGETLIGTIGIRYSEVEKLRQEADRIRSSR